MKQTRIQRKPRRGGGPETPSDLLPSRPASDTSAAARTLAHIDAALAGR